MHRVIIYLMHLAVLAVLAALFGGLCGILSGEVADGVVTGVAMMLVLAPLMISEANQRIDEERYA